MRPLRRLLMKLEDIEIKAEQKFGNKLKSKDKPEIITPEPVTMEDIEAALKTTKCSPGLITEKYVKWVNDFGST